MSHKTCLRKQCEMNWNSFYRIDLCCQSKIQTSLLQCSKECGRGEMVRHVYCVTSDLKTYLDDHECNGTGKPATIATCFKMTCPQPHWVVHDWGEVTSVLSHSCNVISYWSLWRWNAYSPALALQLVFWLAITTSFTTVENSSTVHCNMEVDRTSCINTFPSLSILYI